MTHDWLWYSIYVMFNWLFTFGITHTTHFLFLSQLIILFFLSLIISLSSAAIISIFNITTIVIVGCFIFCSYHRFYHCVHCFLFHHHIRLFYFLPPSSSFPPLSPHLHHFFFHHCHHWLSLYFFPLSHFLFHLMQWLLFLTNFGNWTSLSSLLIIYPLPPSHSSSS